MSRVRVFALAWVVCLGSVPAVAQSGTCSALSQTTFVRDTLDELYYWYRHLPDVDPARVATPEAFLDEAIATGVTADSVARWTRMMPALGSPATGLPASSWWCSAVDDSGPSDAVPCTTSIAAGDRPARANPRW